MPTRAQTIIGAPCWIELIPSDLEKVKPFYKAILNWDFTDFGEEMGHYNVISINDDAVGGAMQHDPAMMGPLVNFTELYFATNDATASLTRSTELGGKVIVETMEVPGQGSFGETTDPEGNSFSVWQPGARQGFDRVEEHGFPAWFELHTRAFDTTTAYYASLLGAALNAMDPGDGSRYASLRIDREDYAGIWDISSVLPADAPTGWTTYFLVDDPDAAVATALELGGTEVSPAEDTPYGRMAVVADPNGARLTVIGATSPQ